MFGAYQDGFFKALETIGQVVAPVVEEETSEHAGEEDNGQDDDPSFDSAIRNFIQQQKQRTEFSQLENAHVHDEPGSPGSLVDVALDDDTLNTTDSLVEQSTPSIPSDRGEVRGLDVAASIPSVVPSMSAITSVMSTSLASLSSSAPSILRPAANLGQNLSSALKATSFSYGGGAQLLSNEELEKKVQSKYREQLEEAYAQLEAECAMWKEKAMNNTVAFSKPNSDDHRINSSRLQDELSQIRSALESTETKLQRSMEQISDLQREKSDLSRQLALEREERKGLATQLEEARGDFLRANEALSRSLDQLQDADRALQQKEEEMSKINDATQASLSRIRALENDCERLSAENDRNQSAMRALETHNNELKALLSSSNASNDQQAEEGSAGEMDKEIQQLRSTLSDKLEVIRCRDEEIVRYEEALQQSEELLKTAEEVAWKSKAEAAEYLSALEFDERKIQKLEAELAALQVTGNSSQISEDQTEQLFENIAKLIGIANLDGVDRLEKMKIVEDRLRQLRAAEEEVARKQAAVLPILREIGEICDMPASMSSEVGFWDFARDILSNVSGKSQEWKRLAGTVQDFQQTVSKLCDQLSVVDKEKAALAARVEQAGRAERQQLTEANDQISSLRAAVQKFENENRQLHQVIQQLRQTRKQQSGEAENALQELVQLRVFSEQCRQENHALELKLTNYNRIFAEHAELSARNVELERQVTRLDAAYQETKRYLLSKEKECSDLQVTVDVSQSELKMLQQDNNQRQLEVTNLRDAMSSLESDYHQLLLQHKQQHHELTQVRAELDMQISKDKSTQLQHELEELQKKVLVAEQLAQDQVLVSRQAQWEFQKEKERLQANLEGVIRQLQNSSQDVIDRALVANLVVSYFQRRRSREVLELIAKVLAFNEEQLVAVGLRVPPINIFASLLQTVIGPAEPVKVEGDNLAELWVNFLIDQSDDKKPPGRPPAVPSPKG